MLCVILACTSCKKDDLLIDIKGEPDKVKENVLCKLSYDNDFKMWSVGYFIQGTHDAIDINLIAKMPEWKFYFKEGKYVLVSGLCYEIPQPLLTKKGLPRLGGMEYYYIKITNINYQ